MYLCIVVFITVNKELSLQLYIFKIVPGSVLS